MKVCILHFFLVLVVIKRKGDYLACCMYTVYTLCKITVANMLILTLVLSLLLMHQCLARHSASNTLSIEISRFRNQTMEQQILQLILFSGSLRRAIPRMCSYYPYECQKTLANRNTTEFGSLRLSQLSRFDNGNEVNFNTTIFCIQYIIYPIVFCSNRL